MIKTLRAVVLAVGIGLSGCDTPTSRPVRSYVYSGEFRGYNVEIVQKGREEYDSRLVHLKSMGDAFPFAITGFDNDSDGRWESIYIRKTPKYGYSGMRFLRDGRQVWEPCPMDRGAIRRFTPGELMQAETLLDGALGAVGNEEHRKR